MTPYSRFHTNHHKKLAVANLSTDFLRANAGYLGRRQKEQQRE